MTATPAPFVVGAPRSGTTLLRFMLDAHPALAIPPETGFLIAADQWRGAADPRQAFFDAVTGFPPTAPGWLDFGIDAGSFRDHLQALDPFSPAEGLRVFYRLYAARCGKPRWGDKTPTYCFHLAELIDLLPEARIVHVIRDGRDVACSIRHLWFTPGKTIEEQAAFWRDCVLAARLAGVASGRYLEVRYEELVRDSGAVLKAVCQFVELPFDPRMLEYYRGVPDRLTEHRDRVRPDGTVLVSHQGRVAQQALTMLPPQPSRIGAWKRALQVADQARFERVAGDLLATLGYL